MTVAAILLAGGESSRMGQPKALLPWGDQRLVEYQIDQLLQPPIERVFVVLGHEAERITPVIDRAGAEVLVNELYKRGRASSLRAGARAVADDTRTILVLDVDQPRPRRVIQRLIENHVRASNVITVPTFEGKRGHPTVVDGWLLPELRRVRERTEGLRGFLDQVIEALRAGIVGAAATQHPVAALAAAARRLAAIDPSRAGVGGLRLQLELALFAVHHRLEPVVCD